MKTPTESVVGHSVWLQKYQPLHHLYELKHLKYKAIKKIAGIIQMKLCCQLHLAHFEDKKSMLRLDKLSILSSLMRSKFTLFIEFSGAALRLFLKLSPFLQIRVPFVKLLSRFANSEALKIGFQRVENRSNFLQRIENIQKQNQITYLKWSW